MRLLALMDNVCNFVGNRVIKVPYTTQASTEPTYAQPQGPSSIAHRASASTAHTTSCKATPSRLRERPLLHPLRRNNSDRGERQTSRTGKGGAHDQYSPHHHPPNTRDPRHDQRIAPQRETTRSQPLQRNSSDRARNQVQPNPSIRIHISPSPATPRPPSPKTWSSTKAFEENFQQLEAPEGRQSPQTCLSSEVFEENFQQMEAPERRQITKGDHASSTDGEQPRDRQSDLPPSRMGYAVANRRGANLLPPGDYQTRR